MKFTTGSGGFQRWLCGGLVALLAGFAGPDEAAADKIITEQGQTLEGVIAEENEFYIHINVRGTIVPVPRERIASVERQDLDANVRDLLDRAYEALSRENISVARTLVEQARTLNSLDPLIVENLMNLDAEIAEMERRGGSPEERRRRSESLLRRANDAYDKIRNEEGDTLLIQSLKSDPTNPEAHRKIQELLMQSNRVDLMLAAEYFVEALYPDNLRADSPVIGLLPAAFAELTLRFEQTTDYQRAQRYVELMRIMDEAFEVHSRLAADATPQQAKLIDQPFDDLIADLIGSNLKRGDFQSALVKVDDWAPPSYSTTAAMLHARAHVGVRELEQAREILTTAAQSTPGSSELRTHAANIEKLMKADEDRRANNREQAETAYNELFASYRELMPELYEAVGERLAQLRAPQLRETSPADAPWRQASVAAIVMRFSQASDLRKQAAQILSATIHSTPWEVRPTLTVNGRALSISETQRLSVIQSIADALNVRTHPDSPFLVEAKIDLRTAGDGANRLVQALNSAGETTDLKPPIEIDALQFELSASSASLGEMLRDGWTIDTLPAAVRQRREQAIAESETPGQEISTELATLRGMDDFNQFISMELSDYISNQAVLTYYLNIPLMKRLLTDENIL